MDEDFIDIISQTNSMKNTITKDSLNIKIFSNTIINPIDKILKYNLKKKNINTFIEDFEFDNLNYKKKKNDKFQVGIVIWEIENIFPNKFLELEFKNQEYIDEIIKDQIKKINFFFERTENFKLIIFKKFSSYNYLADSIYENKISFICEELNKYLLKMKKINSKIVLFEDWELYQKCGHDYYSRKIKNTQLPYYSIDVLLGLSFKISLIILNFFGHSKKVLIVDCDNTLWNGIIGEDDHKKIFSDKDIYKDNFIFANRLISNLKKKGVILAICSKNNYNDVEKFFKKKSKYLANFKEFTVKKINWKSKSQNILEIANELNLGMSSFVFLDDSDFEISEVKNSIKEIDCVKVPKDPKQYNEALIQLCKFFSKTSQLTAEDKSRSLFYTQEGKREKIKEKKTYKDYLKSLQLELNFGLANKFDIDRIVQLTQKTNQFNLTVMRQTKSDILKKLQSDKFLIFAFSLKDKFGEYGTVGLAQINLIKDHALIENFLMSCRVMGREIEGKFLKEITEYLIKKKIKIIEGVYIKNQKNKIVEKFYKQNDFKEVILAKYKNDNKKLFRLNVKNYKKDYERLITVNYA
jgi:FkbH-like protein